MNYDAIVTAFQKSDEKTCKVDGLTHYEAQYLQHKVNAGDTGIEGHFKNNNFYLVKRKHVKEVRLLKVDENIKFPPLKTRANAQDNLISTVIGEEYDNLRVYSYSKEVGHKFFEGYVKAIDSDEAKQKIENVYGWGFCSVKEYTGDINDNDLLLVTTHVA